MEDHGRHSMVNRDDSFYRQAAHFDSHEPISPWPEVLRVEGFKYQYIAKDLIIKETLDLMGIRRGFRVLDVGSGNGIWLDRLGSSYGTIGTGVDISRDSLANARASTVGNNAFALADACALPFADGLFDLVTSMDVLEHVEAPGRALDEMRRVAGGEGTIMVYAISKRNMFTFQWFERKLLGVFGIDLHPLACHDPNLFIDPDLLVDRLNGNDVRLEDIRFFHAFASSIFDRVLLLTYFLFKKLGLLTVRSNLHRILAISFLRTASMLSRYALGVLLWLDRPWLSRGHSNGFLAIARKKPKLNLEGNP